MLDYFSQINIYNKLLLLVVIVLVVLHVLEFLEWRNKWSWSASVCDPYLYPMILERKSYFTDPKSKYSSYRFKEEIPMSSSIAGPYAKKGVRGNWGEPYPNPQGWKKERLPHTLQLSWYSVREDQHYKGTFDLPTETITKYFKKGYKDWKGWRRKKLRFLVGLAPKGKVVLWLSSGHNGWQLELASYTATVDNEIVLDKERKKIALKALTEEELKAVEEAIKSKEPIPDNHWDDLHKQYNYRIVTHLVDVKLTDYFIIHGLNGEVKAMNTADGKYHKGPLPKKLLFERYHSDKDNDEVFVTLNEEELLHIFKSVTADELIEIHLHFDAKEDIIKLHFSSNQDEKEVYVSDIKADYK